MNMLEYLIKEAIDFYMKENKTSKRQAIYAVNEVIKKLSHEVQEEEQKTGKCTISSLYGECVTANPVQDLTHDKICNMVNDLELEWEEIAYFIASGANSLTTTSIRQKDFEMTLHLMPIASEFNRLAEEIHESEVKKNA